jgi:hypothetical protein
MPVRSFSTQVVLRNWEVFNALGERAQNFRPVFAQIIERWVAHNVAKFDEGRGAQLSGAVFDAGGETVIWEGVTDEYAIEKTRDGYENWLMVRDHETINALTMRDGLGWIENVGPMSAEFGAWIDKIEWNWYKRPVMFLDNADREMINDMFGAYLANEPPFVQFVASDTVRMDAEFKSMFRMPGVLS